MPVQSRTEQQREQRADTPGIGRRVQSASSPEAWAYAPPMRCPVPAYRMSVTCILDAGNVRRPCPVVT
eukprot:244099-Rhodomonas_salina.2